MKLFRKTASYYLYAALILLPLILSVILYLNMRSVINSEIQRHAEQTCMQFYLQTSGMIHELQLISYDYSNDSRIIHALSASSSDKVDSLGLCEYISDKKSANRNISHIYIVSSRLDSVYSDEGYFSYSSVPSLLKKIGMLSEEYDFEKYGIDWDIYNNSGYAPFCVTPVLSDAGETKGDTIGHIITALNFNNFLENFYSLDAAVCAVYSDSFYISPVITMNEAQKINWDDPETVNQVTGEPVTCVYRSDSNYRYMVGISNHDYNQPLRILMTGFAVYFIILLAAGLLILWRIFRRRKREAQQNIRERNLRYILYGHSMNNISDRFVADAGLPADTDCTFITAAVFVSQTKDESAPADDLSAAVTRVMKNNIRKVSLSYSYFEDLNGPVFVLWRSDETDLAKAADDICHKATEEILLLYSAQIKICTSGCVRGIDSLCNAFHQATDIYEYSSITHPDKPVISVNDITYENGSSDSFLRAQQTLINTLIADKFDQIPDMVEKIQNEFITPYSSNTEIARKRRRTIANLLSEGLLECGFSAEEKETLLQDFHKANNADALNSVTKQYFESAAKIENRSTKERSVYDEACRYITDNLHDHNISVTMICDALGISARKLTRIFHLYNDMAIAEYVNHLRVDEAQKLLVNRSDLLAAEIAELVGYNNFHSLTRNFRKFTGLTPTEYRELKLQER